MSVFIGKSQMFRCTEWRETSTGSKVACWVQGDQTTRLAEYEDTGWTPEQVLHHKRREDAKTIDQKVKDSEAYLMNLSTRELQSKHLEDIITAYEENRLVILPCNIGDFLYVLKVNTDCCKECEHYSEGCYGDSDICLNPDLDFEIEPRYVDKPICSHQYWEVKRVQMKTLESLLNAVPLIGYRFFTSKEAAEAAKEELEDKDPELWCKNQALDKSDNSIFCTAHVAEDRTFDCPYKSNEDRLSREYPCSDYEPT